MKDSLHLLRFIEDLLIEEDGQSLSDIQRILIGHLLLDVLNIEILNTQIIHRFFNTLRLLSGDYR